MTRIEEVARSNKPLKYNEWGMINSLAEECGVSRNTVRKAVCGLWIGEPTETMVRVRLQAIQYHNASW